MRRTPVGVNSALRRSTRLQQLAVDIVANPVVVSADPDNDEKRLSLEAPLLTNTFCHIPRISLAKEKSLWDKGVLTWDDYRVAFPKTAHIDDSEKHLQKKNPHYFSDGLKSDQHWRLFPDFRDSVAYVDIETTGLDKSYDEITTIALYDGRSVRTYVNGKNLSQFKKDIQDYQVLVTFNGKTFDVPFIKRFFTMEVNHSHIDLRYVLGKLGYTGGLKAIERRFGIDRGDLRDVDGYFAVTLWHEYKRKKNENALETLLAYNCADVVNLERLVVHAFNLNIENTPFKGSRKIPAPRKTPVPFQTDKRLVDRLCRY